MSTWCVHVLTDDEFLPRVKQATGDVVVVSPACVHLPSTGIWARRRTGGILDIQGCCLTAAIVSNLSVHTVDTPHQLATYRKCTHMPASHIKPT